MVIPKINVAPDAISDKIAKARLSFLMLDLVSKTGLVWSSTTLFSEGYSKG